MQIPLQITFRGFDRSEALEDRIRADAAKLEKLNPSMMSCHVTVDETRLHQQKGRQFGVHIDVHLPGRKEVVSTLCRDEDVYVALRDAFEAVGRQLQETVRVARGE